MSVLSYRSNSFGHIGPTHDEHRIHFLHSCWTYTRPLALADMSARGGLGLSRRGCIVFDSAGRWGKQRSDDSQNTTVDPAHADSVVGADCQEK